MEGKAWYVWGQKMKVHSATPKCQCEILIPGEKDSFVHKYTWMPVLLIISIDWCKDKVWYIHAMEYSAI